jgi:hypothetical protein
MYCQIKRSSYVILCNFLFCAGCVFKVEEKHTAIKDVERFDVSQYDLSRKPISLCVMTEALLVIEILQSFGDLQENTLREQVAFRAAEAGCLAKSQGMLPVAERLKKEYVTAICAVGITYSDKLVERHYEALVEYLDIAPCSFSSALLSHPDKITWEDLFIRNTISSEVGMLFLDPSNAPEQLLQDEQYLRLLVLSAMSSRATSIAIALKSVRNDGFSQAEETSFEMIVLWRKALDELYRNIQELEGDALAFVTRAAGERHGLRGVGNLLGETNILTRNIRVTH